MKTLASSRRASVRVHTAIHAGKRPANGNGGSSSAKAAIGSQLSAWLSTPRRQLINGRWVAAASGKTFDVFNPADGSVIARVAEGDLEDINRAVSAARRAFESGPWSRMTPRDRGKLLWRIGDLILEHGDELAELESIDNGKPRAVARVADIPLAADLFHYMAGWATKIEGATIALSIPDAQFHAYTLREPVGVGGQIIPWNFPLLMAAWKLGPALAAGNCSVLKPAEQTPLDNPLKVAHPQPCPPHPVQKNFHIARVKGRIDEPVELGKALLVRYRDRHLLKHRSPTSSKATSYQLFSARLSRCSLIRPKRQLITVH